MKGASHILLVIMILTALLSASCGSGSSSPDTNCINGDCVTVAVTGPIRLNQPVKVTVTIKTKDDQPDAWTGIDVSPGAGVAAKIEGEHGWRVSTKAGQSYSFTSQVRFTQSDYYTLIGTLAAKVGWHQQSSILVHVSETGGEVVPPDTKFDTHGTAVPVSPLPLSPNPATSPSPFVSPLPKPASSPNPFASPLATPKSPPPSAAPVWTPAVSPTPFSSSATAEPMATPKSPPPSAVPGVIPTLPITPVSSLAPAEPVATLTSNFQSLQPSQSPAQWVTVEIQGWEGAFSNWGTVNLNGVSLWGLSTYRAHSGNVAIWPGGEQPNPALGYANNEHTRLQYGPFAMGDAVTAQVVFWLWRDIAASDYLAFEVSTDGVTWKEKARWATGTVGWEQEVIQVDECALASNCWVGWRFYSDASGTGQGPWLDDISIGKYRPGDVTVSGSFQYDDPANARRPARSLRVTVYEVDPDGLDWLAEGTTDANGRFQFGPFMDWDWDGTNPDVNAKRLDLQSVFTSTGVTNFSRAAYEWASEVRQDVPPGASVWNYGSLAGDPKRGAMWIHQDLVRGR